MKRLLSLLLVVLVSPLFGATLQEECYEAHIQVNEVLDIYNRVNARVTQDRNQYHFTLKHGLQNLTLLSEIKRDEHYLELSTPILHRLYHFKDQLNSKSKKYEYLNVDDKRNIIPKIKVLAHQHERITDILSQIQKLLEQHKDIFEHTLMPNNNRQ